MTRAREQNPNPASFRCLLPPPGNSRTQLTSEKQRQKLSSWNLSHSLLLLSLPGGFHLMFSGTHAAFLKVFSVRCAPLALPSRPVGHTWLSIFRLHSSPPPSPTSCFLQELSHSGLHHYSQLNTSSFTIKYSYIYAQSAQQTPILPSDTCCILYSPLTSWLHSFLGLI